MYFYVVINYSKTIECPDAKLIHSLVSRTQKNNHKTMLVSLARSPPPPRRAGATSSNRPNSSQMSSHIIEAYRGDMGSLASPPSRTKLDATLSGSRMTRKSSAHPRGWADRVAATEHAEQRAALRYPPPPILRMGQTMRRVCVCVWACGCVGRGKQPSIKAKNSKEASVPVSATVHKKGRSMASVLVLFEWSEWSCDRRVARFTPVVGSTGEWGKSETFHMAKGAHAQHCGQP